MDQDFPHLNDESDEKVQRIEKANEAFLTARQRAYMLTFKNEMAKLVLEDLEKFCRAKESTFHVEPRAHALLEGRREVFLRLQDHLELPLGQLLVKYGGKLNG